MVDLSLKASDANVWVNCSGSVQNTAHYPELPDHDSDGRNEGKAFHRLGEELVEAYITPGVDMPTASRHVGQMSEFNVVIDPEMFDAAMDYAKDISDNATTYAAPPFLERELPIQFLRPGDVVRPDAYIIQPEANALIVYDAKYGHSFVSEFENYQLIIGAQAILDHHGFSGEDFDIEMRMFQPRSYDERGTFRSWCTNSDQLAPYIDRIIKAKDDALSDCPDLTPGPHCRKCAACRGCIGLQRASYDSIDFIKGIGPGALPDNDHLAIELSYLQRGAELIKTRLTGLEAQAKHQLRNGETITGYRLQPVTGRTGWSSGFDVDTIAGVAEMMGVDIRQEPSLITPKQAVKKGVDETVINAYTETPSRGVKLAQTDDAHIRRIFSENKT